MNGRNFFMHKRIQKYLLLLFTLFFTLCLAACTFHAGSGNSSDSTEGSAKAAAGSLTQGTTAGQTNGTAADITEDQADIPSKNQKKDIMILFTSDVHCGVDEGFGLVGLEQIRTALTQQGYEVLLVDDGDFIQGGPSGSVTKGEAIIDLMNEMHYDAVIPGNHEFDYGIDHFFHLMSKAGFPVISCNLTKEGKLVFPPYLIKEVSGLKIAFVGVTTPQSLTSASPKSFQNDKGEYVYGFMQDKSGQKLYDAVQKAVDQARAEGADYVYILGHMGNNSLSAPWTYADVISHTNGIDVFLDGHSHDTDQVVMKNKDGKEVVRSACGTRLNCIGYSHISPEKGILDTNIWTWTNSESAPSVFGLHSKIDKKLNEEMAIVKESLSEEVGETSFDLIVNDPVEKDSRGVPVRMVRRAETNLGDFCADAYRDQGAADVGLINGGGVRANIPKGIITYESLIKVQPFNNSLVIIEATGQQILDALEWGCRNYPAESGGFLQVSGLTYEIDARIDSGCKKDESGKFAGVEGPRRVQNVKVGNEPLDPEKKYTVAGDDFLLLNQGDGQTAFDKAKVLDANKKQDLQLFTDYIRDTLGGKISDDYADPYGQGRIVIIE